MNETAPSRFEGVRSQLITVRRGATAAAIVGFAAIVGLARASHPGTTSPTPSTGGGGVTQSSTTDDDASGFFFGGGTVSSSDGSAPSIQSGGS